MKKELIRNSVYATNNHCAAESVVRILFENHNDHDEMIRIIETALNAAEYKGRATPEALRIAIETSMKSIYNSEVPYTHNWNASILELAYKKGKLKDGGASMKSIDRLAMDIAGKSETSTELFLTRFGFSPAEISKIISSSRWSVTGVDGKERSRMTSDWQAIAVTIKSTMQTSINLGDRLDFGI